MLLTIVIFLLLLSILVIAHELGHFVTARKLGMKVEEFGLGYPPRALSWTSPKTDIRWSLNWIPVGGFVKMRGENGEDLWDPENFSSKPLWKRCIVLVAGVTMNVIVAWVFFTAVLGFGVHAIVEQNDSSAIITDRAFEVTDVLDGSPAHVGGLLVGDRVTTIDGQQFVSGEALRTYLMGVGQNAIVTFQVDRGGQNMDVQVVPAYLDSLGRIGLGVAVYETGSVRYPWYSLGWEGMKMTWWYTQQICVGLYGVLANALSGNGFGMEVSGPIGIAVMTGQAAKMGFIYLLQFGAILSINLAILNILPLPALDGGRMLFLAIETGTRRRVNQKVEAMIHNIGFLALMLLVLLVTYRDVLGLFQR